MITKAEVERELKYAKDPAKQIRIIAELNGITAEAVWKLVGGDQRSLPKLRRAADKNHIWAEAELDRIVDMYNQGNSLHTIATSFGFESETAIRTAISNHILGKRGDFALRTRGWSGQDFDAAAEMRRRGASYDEIGERFGKSRACVYQMLKRHMVDFNRYADRGGKYGYS